MESTGVSGAALVARLTLGGIFFAHGAQKLFGWFGGYGFKGTFDYFRNALRVPAPLAFAAVVAELVASVMLVLGFSSRLAALIVIAEMAAAIQLSHRDQGFFMNYFGRLPAGKEGYEYNLALIGLALVILILGSGRYALDGLWGSDFLSRLSGAGRALPPGARG